MATSSLSKGFLWKLLERFGVQFVQFVLQIVLARVLDPQHYGVLSLMIIFTTLATVFIQTGFSASLIQNKDVTEEDYSSVFWVSLGIAGVLYVLLFFAAPFIGAYYNMPDFSTPFRVLALILFPGALNSVQLAKVSRKLDFRNVFISNIGAIVVSGVVGVVLAYAGAGLWALVIHNLLNILVASVIMLFTVKWRPRRICNIQRVKILFSYGWKLLVSNLIDTLYQDLRSLVIGKKYSSDTLGYYNRGKQFPQFIINAVNGTVQSVMLPAMSEKQDSKEQVKRLMRTSITISAFIILPIMAGLAAAAPSIVDVLLTDKWAPCIPYLQIYCVSLAFYPVHSCNLQAINAVGRSDLFLILEIIKKCVGVGALFIAVCFFDSPIAIAATGVCTTVISFFVNAFPNKKLIGYSYSEQLRDLMPSFCISVAMFAVVYALNYVALNSWITLCIQITSGALIYVGLSHIFRVEAYRSSLEIVKSFKKKKV